MSRDGTVPIKFDEITYEKLRYLKYRLNKSYNWILRLAAQRLIDEFEKEIGMEIPVNIKKDEL